MRVLVGVSAGIAAYKAAHVVRAFVEAGAEVHVVPTPAALSFVGTATWEALSGHPVRTQVFEDVDTVAHVAMGQSANLVLIVPATADLLARAATGRADDLLTSSLLATTAPVVMAPAMHTEMWNHAATRANVATLRGRGVHVIEPASGRLTGADSGPGRLPEPGSIVAACAAVLAGGGAARDGDLTGWRMLVTAGGTREALDPVRYLGNHSSGRQGWALAAAAIARGADVELIAANVVLDPVAGADVVHVASAAELEAEVFARAEAADVVVMAAAVADFRPIAASAVKLKKREPGSAGTRETLELEQTPDILRGLVERFGPRIDAGKAPSGIAPTCAESARRTIVGFAAETGDETTSALEHARAKARRKKADLLIANDVSAGAVFGRDTSAVTLLDAEGETLGSASGSKTAVAHAILDALSRMRRESLSPRPHP